jgi:antitoxin (DNA-binding transcriptional repressor) of toxin-antitoxin stability system
MGLGTLARILANATTKMRQRRIDGLDACKILRLGRRSSQNLEVQIKDEKVQARIVAIKQKRKKGPSDANEACQAAKKQRQMDARAEVLALPMPVGKMVTLRERRALQLKEA